MGLERGNGKGGHDLPPESISDEGRQFLTSFQELLRNTEDTLQKASGTRRSSGSQGAVERAALSAVRRAYDDANTAMANFLENMLDGNKFLLAEQAKATLEATLMEMEQYFTEEDRDK
ncbi:hypothetical protein C4585_03290 [Candidatus Parcubacteria bacterium]|nr:MAG: hypothetical protein C4585_03290 [Candidatus Parcubacteria bacterium]